MIQSPGLTTWPPSKVFIHPQSCHGTPGVYGGMIAILVPLRGLDDDRLLAKFAHDLYSCTGQWPYQSGNFLNRSRLRCASAIRSRFAS
jgi:hypothetical protein